MFYTCVQRFDVTVQKFLALFDHLNKASICLGKMSWGPANASQSSSIKATKTTMWQPRPRARLEHGNREIVEESPVQMQLSGSSKSWTKHVMK
jgi:hypothetical protein